MKLAWIALLSALAIASPQFWGRIGLPSLLQPVFMLLFVAQAFRMGGLRLPRSAGAQTLLGGLGLLLLGGLLSTPFVRLFDLHLQEVVRRAVLMLFLWAAFSMACHDDRLIRALRGFALVASVLYLASMALYFAGWAPLRDSGYFDAYPFGLLVPIPLFSNPMTFSETQVFGYFLLGIAVMSAAQGYRRSWLTLIIGLLQFGKGPIVGYLASRLPRLSRALALALVLMLPVLFIVASNHAEIQRFDGDFGSFAERSFHLSVVHHALMDHPLGGALGYGLRQYGAHLLTQSTDFTEDAVPLSVAQWAFEAGLPIALSGMALLVAGSIFFSGRRYLPVGLCLLVGHLALPNPADASVLLLFALLAGAIDTPSSSPDDPARLP